MNTPNNKQPFKSSSCDASNDQEGVEKSQKKDIHNPKMKPLDYK